MVSDLGLGMAEFSSQAENFLGTKSGKKFGRVEVQPPVTVRKIGRS